MSLPHSTTVSHKLWGRIMWYTYTTNILLITKRNQQFTVIAANPCTIDTAVISLK